MYVYATLSFKLDRPLHKLEAWFPFNFILYLMRQVRHRSFPKGLQHPVLATIRTSILVATFMIVLMVLSLDIQTCVSFHTAAPNDNDYVTSRP